MKNIETIRKAASRIDSSMKDARGGKVTNDGFRESVVEALNAIAQDLEELTALCRRLQEK